ncbi:MAG: lytic murein transglycosylase [Deinococcus-Thermus bacterium]|jgi:lytic murein transglycosylase|nr:lytic murein transglycosylase [Deinococcota bacterium]
MRRVFPITALSIAGLLASPAAASVPCGGPFPSFRAAMAAEARARGHDAESVTRFFDGVRRDPSVIRADRRQGIFQLPFVEFARRLISRNRLENGRRQARRHANTFAEIEARYGIPAGVLLAFWAFETDYGAVQGDYNTVNALMTLAHDCRRPDLFRPEVFAALELYERGGLDPDTTTGAWAGEIGMVQMLPSDILAHGQDGDGDGRVRLKSSPEDALLSGADMLSDFGWRAGEPWLREVTVPERFDWSLTGLRTRLPVAEWQAMGVRARSGDPGPARLRASLLVPQGRLGPAFLAYPNLDVYFEWNQSFTYVLTAAYFATRIEGAPVFDAGDPAPGLSGDQMKRLQEKLRARGHDVGGVDGILGAKTRAAVQAEQERLGLPADAWPTPELLARL